ncbi:hypothetical protein [Micromonospora sp. NPDC001898]
MPDNRPDSKPLPLYDWASKRPTRDTAAASEQVLRDASKPKESRR